MILHNVTILLESYCVSILCQTDNIPIMSMLYVVHALQDIFNKTDQELNQMVVLEVELVVLVDVSSYNARKEDSAKRGSSASSEVVDGDPEATCLSIQLETVQTTPKFVAPTDKLDGNTWIEFKLITLKQRSFRRFCTEWTQCEVTVKVAG